MLGRTHKPRTTPAATDFSDRRQRMYTFLKETPIGVLSTIDPDGNPHGTVIYFTLNKQFRISFLTKADTRKYDNLMRHNHVMLTVFDARSQTTAQITGRAEEVTESAELNSIAGHILGASLQTSDSNVMPITKLEAGPYAAFHIQPLQIRMAMYARPNRGEYSDVFESVESFELAAGND